MLRERVAGAIGAEAQCWCGKATRFAGSSATGVRRVRDHAPVTQGEEVLQASLLGLQDRVHGARALCRCFPRRVGVSWIFLAKRFARGVVIRA